LGNNLFAYCSNNPVNISDPSGCIGTADDDLWYQYQDEVEKQENRSQGLIYSSSKVEQYDNVATVTTVDYYFDNKNAARELIDSIYCPADELIIVNGVGGIAWDAALGAASIGGILPIGIAGGIILYTFLTATQYTKIKDDLSSINSDTVRVQVIITYCSRGGSGTTASVHEWRRDEE